MARAAWTALPLAIAAAGCLARIDDDLIDHGDPSAGPGVAAADGGSPARSPGAPDVRADSAPPEAPPDAWSGGDGSAVADARVGDDHLVGRWDFEVIQGGTSPDLSGQNHVAVIANGALAPGRLGVAVKLTGNGGSIEIPGLTAGAFPTPGTFSLWIMMGTPPDPEMPPGTLLDSDDPTRNHVFVGPWARNTFLMDVIPTGEQTLTIPDTGWHHLVLVWTAGDVRAYVDNALAGSVNTTPTWNASLEHVRLGYGMFVTIDQVRLYDVALGAAAVSSIPL
jgi:hypothetical protein